jgi:hypothetical protein
MTCPTLAAVQASASLVARTAKSIGFNTSSESPSCFTSVGEIAGVSGHDQNRYTRGDRPDFAGEFESAEAGHGEVGDHGVVVRGVLAEAFEGLARIGTGIDPESLVFEQRAGAVEQGHFVVDEQDDVVRSRGRGAGDR